MFIPNRPELSKKVEKLLWSDGIAVAVVVSLRAANPKR